MYIDLHVLIINKRDDGQIDESALHVCTTVLAGSTRVEST